MVSSDAQSYSDTDEVVQTLTFKSKDKDVSLRVYNDGDTNAITIMAGHTNPFAKIPRVNGYYGYTFLDEDTIYTP